MHKRQDGSWWRVYSRYHALWVLLLLAGWVAFPVGGAAQALRFEFGLIGDLPYNPEQEAKFPHLIQAMNEANLAFVVHNGDFKSGVTSCSDEIFADRKALFQTSKHSFIFLPGDNEWTDCHDAKAVGYDPIERLTKLREVFFQGDHSLGQRTLPLTRQSNDPPICQVPRECPLDLRRGVVCRATSGRQQQQPGAHVGSRR